MFVNRTTEKGTAIVLIAFAIFALFALVALAMDGGQAFADRRHAQSAVDAAAYAAALAYHEDDPDLLHPLKMALQRVGSNGYPYTPPGSVITNGISYSDENNTMSVVRTTLDSDCAGGYGVKYVVTLTTTVHTWFAPIVGITELHNTVSSTSLACKSTADTNTLETQKTSIMSCSTDSCSGASDTNIFKNGSSAIPHNLLSGIGPEVGPALL